MPTLRWKLRLVCPLSPPACLPANRCAPACLQCCWLPGAMPYFPTPNLAHSPTQAAGRQAERCVQVAYTAKATAVPDWGHRCLSAGQLTTQHAACSPACSCQPLPLSAPSLSHPPRGAAGPAGQPAPGRRGRSQWRHTGRGLPASCGPGAPRCRRSPPGQRPALSWRQRPAGAARGPPAGPAACGSSGCDSKVHLKRLCSFVLPAARLYQHIRAATVTMKAMLPCWASWAS